MWFKIDVHSHLSLNEQIKTGIKESILKDRINVGDVLPSIRELALSLKVNPNTVIRAYKELEAEGIIFAKQGIGYIVLKGKDEVREIVLKDLAKKFSEHIFRLKKLGFELNEVLEVIQRVWEEK